jgi:nitrogen fixation protein NifU and related proteins
MMDQLYRDIILEHWKNPQNYGVIQNADIDVVGTNPFCGDTLRLTVKIEKNTISEIHFTAEGCAISKASASLFTEEIKGKTLKEIKQIQPEDVLKLLAVTLTPSRTKCALLVYRTLQKALA